MDINSKKNQLSVSYGLIVITKNKKVVLIERKIPYCVQNFMMQNEDQFNLRNYEDSFLNDHFKTLNFSMKLDYLSFRKSLHLKTNMISPTAKCQQNVKLL